MYKMYCRLYQLVLRLATFILPWRKPELLSGENSLMNLIGISESGDSDVKKATSFIEAIKKLNRDMKIPDKVAGIVDRDIPLMVERALKEANPLYPVPKILTKHEMFELYQLIRE